MSTDILIKKISAEFGARVEESSGSRHCISLPMNHFLGAMQLITREWNGAVRLLFATAVYNDEALFWMAELYCVGSGSISVRAKVGSESALPSLREIWPHADWQEREAQELFGLQFQGSNEFEPFLLRNARTQFPHRRQ